MENVFAVMMFKEIKIVLLTRRAPPRQNALRILIALQEVLVLRARVAIIRYACHFARIQVLQLQLQICQQEPQLQAHQLQPRVAFAAAYHGLVENQLQCAVAKVL